MMGDSYEQEVNVFVMRSEQILFRSENSKLAKCVCKKIIEKLY